MRGGFGKIYSLEDIRARVRPVAEKYHLRAVYVFGSYARGEAREDSDIDLLIDAEGSGLRGLAFGGLYEELLEVLEKPIDMITVCSLTQPTQHASDMRFREMLLRERKRIYGGAGVRDNASLTSDNGVPPEIFHPVQI